MKQTYNTALYMRLSRDDETCGDSVSIESQRTILRQYATANNLNVVDEYIDDGWSGTNFDRPAFKRMMEDVETGKINCIVTKDLSRFGREHIMMDYYLEFVFPEKKVRYVAVAENEDTENKVFILLVVLSIIIARLLQVIDLQYLSLTITCANVIIISIPLLCFIYRNIVDSHRRDLRKG